MFVSVSFDRSTHPSARHGQLHGQTLRRCREFLSSLLGQPTKELDVPGCVNSAQFKSVWLHRTHVNNARVLKILCAVSVCM